MRFRCPHCNAFGTVRSSEQQSPTVTYLYVQCTNLECGHNWRMDAAAALTLSPSAQPRTDVLIPLSPYVRRTAVDLHMKMAPEGEHKKAGPLQLELIEQDAPITQHPS